MGEHGYDLTGRAVVITGAAGGIGQALARRFHQARARVALLDVDEAPLGDLAAALSGDGSSALALSCDVTSFEQCRDALSKVVATWGGVDVLINNAGITHLSFFRETDVEVIRRVMEVNFFGAVHCTQAALESLVERRGQIVIVSSIAGFAPLATRCGYSASKHALHGLFESLRVELEDSGVDVTLVCPSFVRTGIGDHALGGDGGKPLLARTQTGRPAEPAELADAVYRATVQRRRLLLPSREARLSRLVSRLSPRAYDRMMSRRILPER